MSSITSDTIRIIDCAGADPTFTEVFSRLSYATHTEVKETLRWLERKGLIVSYYTKDFSSEEKTCHDNSLCKRCVWKYNGGCSEWPG